MNANDKLFELISSLSKSEKRYFILNSGFKGGMSNYLKLFKAILAQKVYDETAFKKKFSKEKFIKNLAYNKNYLYTSLLNTLAEYYRSNHVDLKILELIAHSQILYGKSLIVQSIKSLKKARDLAEKYERHEILTEILRLIRQRIALLFYPVHMEKEIGEIYTEIEKNTGLIRNKNEFDNFHSKISSLYIHKGLARSSREAGEFLKIINNNYYKNGESAKSFHAKFTQYQDLALYHLERGNLEESLSYRKKQIALAESMPHLGEENPAYFSIPYYNYIHISRLLKKHDEIPGSIKKLRSIKIKTKEDYSRITLPAYHMELGWYIETGQFENGLKLIDEILDAVKKYKSGTARVAGTTLYLYYDIARLYFMYEKHDNAFRYLSYFLNSFQVSTAQIYFNAKVLNLIVCFELGNFDFLDYQLRSTYRYLVRKKKAYKFETILLDFLRKSFRIKTNNQLTEELDMLKNKLNGLLNDTFEYRAIADLYIIPWLISKTQRKKIIDVLKENYNMQ